MFKRKTAVVVGAGASVDVGFPSGAGLLSQIGSLLELDEDAPLGFSNQLIQQIFYGRHPGNPGAFNDFIGRMRIAAGSIIRALPAADSIDRLIDSLEDDDVTALAKMVISLVILDAEKSSPFWLSSMSDQQLMDTRRDRRRRIDIRNEKMLASWYYTFARLLFSGAQRSKLDSIFSNVTFIIFNYDRCLEQFLYEVIQDRFNVDGQTAAAVLASATFIHPYGDLGPLAWETRPGSPTRAFGHADGVDYWQVASNLRTFTETVNGDLDQRIRSVMGESYAHLFLGFGFLDQNVRLLKPVGNRRAGVSVATALGFSYSDQQVVARLLTSLGSDAGVTIGVESCTCAQLLDHRRLELTTI